MMVFLGKHCQEAIMDAFIQRHRDQIVGVLSGCDRVLFRGTLRSISYLDGMQRLLATYRVPLPQFAGFVRRVSDGIKQHAPLLSGYKSNNVNWLGSTSSGIGRFWSLRASNNGILSNRVMLRICKMSDRLCFSRSSFFTMATST